MTFQALLCKVEDSPKEDHEHIWSPWEKVYESNQMIKQSRTCEYCHTIETQTHVW